MFVGTGSDVGKSLVNAAFCRIFLQEGYTPAPFKAQNMSLNSFVTLDGREIGRAQAVQADACRIPCSSDMNPVLLKPLGNLSSQLVLNGKPVGNVTAKSYFTESDREMLFSEAMQAYGRLEARYNPVVIEGAGSISELNLRDKDITNMRVALETRAAVILVADIDRGGVFGSVYGTLELLPSEERELVIGVIINKFRGDKSLFEPGVKMLESLIKVPVLGVIPYFNDIVIENEDSVSLDKKSKKAVGGKLNIAVIRLKQVSNFTDFDIFEQVPGVNIYFSDDITEIEKADIMIIPGSKNTIADLRFMKQAGIADSIITAKRSGKAVYGICGGYQMMGELVSDPAGVEGEITEEQGLGILPVTTVFGTEKSLTNCRFFFRGSSEPCSGYEIHMGQSTSQTPSPVARLDGAADDGYFADSKTWGTYIHGIFDNAVVVSDILSAHGIIPHKPIENYQSFKHEQLDKLAEHVRRNVNLDYIRDVLKA